MNINDLNPAKAAVASNFFASLAVEFHLCAAAQLDLLSAEISSSQELWDDLNDFKQEMFEQGFFIYCSNHAVEIYTKIQRY